jgi:hypothetical protein
VFLAALAKAVQMEVDRLFPVFTTPSQAAHVPVLIHRYPTPEGATMSFTVTAQHLAAIAGRTTGLMAGLAEWINRICPDYEIDTPQEFCHFLAQACHETDHFVTLREYASGRAYEGRMDLGNTQPGDGVRFRGRGIFKTPGAPIACSWASRRGAATCLSTIQSCWNSPNTQSGAPANTGEHAASTTLPTTWTRMC